MNLKNRDFLKLLDFTPEEIEYLIDLAAKLKAMKKSGTPHKFLEGKNAALIFEKTSTRTRCAFEVAAHDLGMGTTYLNPTDSQIGKKETIADTARVLSGMYEGIEYRGFGQEIVEELAEYASVPVWNGLTNEFHPTQILADFLTVKEHFGKLKGINFVYIGDCRFNMGNSLMVGGVKMGMNITLCSPIKYQPHMDYVNECRDIAEETGAKLRFARDPYEAVKNADVIYTDVWVSMGEPIEVWEERISELKDYQVNKKLMDAAPATCVFMHCLPAYHDLKTEVGKEIGERFQMDAIEVTNEVFESSQSIVFKEAENRMHTIKAVIAATLVDNIDELCK
ncbi:MAG: ornithine carbamoyltransferase [Ruminococcaceae bacterium]|nr:ornithine carbamoyltransferase [Oscillospiraceae bacterium]